MGKPKPVQRKGKSSGSSESGETTRSDPTLSLVPTATHSPSPKKIPVEVFHDETENDAYLRVHKWKKTIKVRDVKNFILRSEHICLLCNPLEKPEHILYGRSDCDTDSEVLISHFCSKTHLFEVFWYCFQNQKVYSHFWPKPAKDWLATMTLVNGDIVKIPGDVEMGDSLSVVVAKAKTAIEGYEKDVDGIDVADKCLRSSMRKFGHLCVINALADVWRARLNSLKMTDEERLGIVNRVLIRLACVQDQARNTILLFDLKNPGFYMEKIEEKFVEMDVEESEMQPNSHSHRNLRDKLTVNGVTRPGPRGPGGL